MACTSLPSFSRIGRVLVRSLIVQCHESDTASLAYDLAEALCVTLVRYADITADASFCVPPCSTMKRKKAQKSPHRFVMRKLSNLARSTVRYHRPSTSAAQSEAKESDPPSSALPLKFAIDAFLKVARQTTAEYNGTAFAALTCIHQLVTECPSVDAICSVLDQSSLNVETLRVEMIDIMVQHFTGGKFASPGQVVCVQSFLCSLSQDEFAKSVLEPISKKMRASPDSAIEMVAAVCAVRGNFSLQNQSFISLESHILEGAMMLTSTIRQLLRPTNATHAATIINALIAISPLDKTPHLMVNGLLETLQSGGKLSAATPDQRLIIYKALQDAACIMLCLLNSEVSLDLTTLVSSVLRSLSSAVSKEASSYPHVKESGCHALAAWLALSCKVPDCDKSAVSSFLQSTLTGTAAVISKEFRLCVGTVLLSDVWSLIPEKTTSATVVQDLLFDKQSKDKVLKGLVAVVENAVKKHSAGSTALSFPLDGLLAVYLCISGAKSPQECPESIISVAEGFAGSVSFLYSPTLMDQPCYDPVIQLLPLIVRKMCDFHDPEGVFCCKQVNDVSRAMAACLTNPWQPKVRENALQVMELILKSTGQVLNIVSKVAVEVSKLVNERSARSILEQKQFLSKREKRDLYEPVQEDMPKIMERDFNVKGVRDTAFLFGKSISYYLSFTRLEDRSSLGNLIGKLCATILMLMHVGCSTNSQKYQRQALMNHSLKLIEDSLCTASFDPEQLAKTFTEVLGPLACGPSSDASLVINNAAICAIYSLVQIAAQKVDLDNEQCSIDESPETKLLRLFSTLEMPLYVATRLEDATKAFSRLTQSDIDWYRSPEGVLYRFSEGEDSDINVYTASEAKKAVTKNRIGKGGVSLLEEEEWERQIKREQAMKKKKEMEEVGGAKALTPEEKALLQKQTQRRKEVAAVMENEIPRSLATLTAICDSDIMVGNKCIQIFSHSVLCFAICDCVAKQQFPALSSMGFEAVSTLASTIYEIDEDCSSGVARALLKCLNPTKSGDIEEVFKSLKERPVSAFPTWFTEAASVIENIDAFGDNLCENSFWFVMPILRAALTGPRTLPGSEAVLEVISRHIPQVHMLADHKRRIMRKDLCLSVLELLSHDRSQTFLDPTPYEVLKALYTEIEPTVDREPFGPDLTPFLGESGALGSKNCRLGSMIALEAILSQFPNILKGNPLVENRLWINCFDKNDDVKEAARKAWRAATSKSSGNDGELCPPSKLYAVPLIALLNNENQDIRTAAADSFAQAMGLLPDTAEKAILRLCLTFIEAFPEEIASKSESKVDAIPKGLTTQAQPKPVVKKIVKKVVKPSATSSAIAGIGAGKKVVRKVVKKTTIDIPAPKAPPVMSKEQLESQFFGAIKKEIDEESEDKVETRLGVLKAISSIAAENVKIDLDFSSLKLLCSFLMSYAIADSNEQVGSVSRDGAKDVIAKFGGNDAAIEYLLPLIEGVLAKGTIDDSTLGELPTKKLPRSVEASDRRKEGAVVALGSVALHLKGDAYIDKIDSTIDMLLEALKTPSEGVQSSVAASLSRLMKKGRTQERIESIISKLMTDCLHGNTYAIRRGSAYGLSAVVKGSGIACLKKYDIVQKLEQGCASGSANTKEGSLCAIELLCERLGLLFEPYVIVLLPSLLRAFSDSSDYVRKAAGGTAHLIMSKLSTHGVKLVMPAILSAFDEPEWRTKQASIIMLGSMSNLAPKQLASSLPKIVPKLTEAFGDSHPKVKASAEQSLNEISKVIRNPEISELSPILVSALTDPAHETKRALEALIETEFLHAIDAPSLALIIPVLYRGLRDRSASSKRMAALIAGNICTMISDPRDFTPYLPIIIPGLKAALLDPIPDVRSTSAKALGSLTRGLGEDSVPDLRSWLIEKIQGESESTVERSGAAQGLTEVLIAGGAGVVESVMGEELYPLASHPKASSREGVLWMLAFLPSSLGLAFAPMIENSLPIILNGLADDSEPVRDVAMRAGRVLVRSHGKAHVDTILPSLEIGLENDDWHIRLASLTLMGDLLSMIGGTKMVKGDGDTQEDARQAERAQAQIALVLGGETRKRVLSRVYLSRSDNTSAVRSMAVQVWKTVVSVTPRTLRDILQDLVSQIVIYLASGNPYQTEVGGRCLGDVVSKLGESVLPEIIPVLRNSLYKGGKHTRQGACIGLGEVISCSSKEHIIKYLSIIVKAVQDALCDEDDGVRSMAAGCFQSLYNLVGGRALDEVVPTLLVAMQDDVDERTKSRALQGLTGILSVRSRELLPYLLPRLLSRPITAGHANALGTISSVTGSTIYVHYGSIIPTLISELSEINGQSNEEEKVREEALRSCARSISGSVDTSGVNILVSEITKRCTSDKAAVRRESCWFLGVIPEESEF